MLHDHLFKTNPLAAGYQPRIKIKYDSPAGLIAKTLNENYGDVANLPLPVSFSKLLQRVDIAHQDELHLKRSAQWILKASSATK